MNKDSGGLGPIHISAGSIALIGGLFLRARHERLLEPRFYSVPGKTNLVFDLILPVLLLALQPATRVPCGNHNLSCKLASLCSLL